MYLRQFGLRRPPFEETANPDFFYANPNHEAALSAALERIRGKGGIVLVQGGSGSGKTMLASVLMQRLQGDVHTLSFSLPHSGPDGLLRRICAEFRPESSPYQDAERCIEVVTGGLAALSDPRCVVIIDQAEHLRGDELLSAERLVKSAGAAGIRLSIVLFANPSIDTSLRLPELRVFSRHVKRAQPLGRLRTENAAAYLAARLRAAGADRYDIFTESAARRIAAQADGSPRRINEIAKRALLDSAGRGAKLITEEIVLHCSKESVFMGATKPDSGPEQRTTTCPPSTSADAVGGDAGRIPSLARRIEELLAAAPARVEALEGAVRELESRAEAAIRKAVQRAEAQDVGLEPVDDEAQFGSRISRLEGAVRKADEALEKLADFARQLDQVGRVSEERIKLLLTSLDAAQGIHEKLERVGEEVTGLVEASQQSAVVEHDSMQTMFDELSKRRTEIGATIDSLRAERQAALEENRQVMSEQLAQIRAIAEQSRAESTSSVECIHRAVADARREQLAALENERKWISGELEKIRTRAGEQIDQIRAAADEAQTNAASSLEQIRTTSAESRDRQVLAAKECTRSFGEQLSALKAAGKNAYDECLSVLDQARSAKAYAQQTLETMTQQTRQFGDQLAAMTRSQERSVQLTEDVTGAADQLQANVKEAMSATRLLAEQTERAVEIRSESNAVLQRSAADGVKSVEQAALGAERRIAETTARLESLVATEKCARDTAAEAIRSAKSALVMVKESESKLAEARESAIAVEATATAALASVQEQLKRLEDSADSLVKSCVARASSDITIILDDCKKEGREYAQTVHRTAEQTARSLERMGTEQIKRATHEADQAATTCITRINEVQAGTLGSIRAHCTETTEYLEQAANTSIERINEAQAESHTLMRAHCKEAGEEFERMSLDAQKVCADAVSQLDTARAQSVGDLRHTFVEGDRRIGALLDKSLSRLDSEAQRCCAENCESIERISQSESRRVEESIASAAIQAEDRVNAAASSMATAINERIAAATQTAAALAEADAAARKTVADANTCREQIDHLIRDVWSLTTTTDQRARTLSALADTVQGTENRVSALVQRAEALGAQLAERASVAEAAAALLADRQHQTDSTCATVTEKMAEAKQVGDQLALASDSGRRTEEALSNQSGKLKELIGTADSIVRTIRADDETTRATSRTVGQLTTVTSELESKLGDLREALADPISVIQEARGQAEELNEICLSVKRVFRGVSRASLEANERMKTLGEFLAMTERSAESMQQWVAEATRVQDRLAATIKKAPSVGDTHPIVALPDLRRSPMPTELKGAAASAEDIALIRRTVESQDPPSQLTTQQAGRSAGSAIKASATATAQPVPKATGAGDDSARVGPYVEALVARASEMAADIASVEQTNKASVRAAGPKAAGTATPPGRNRLGPEDVRAMIAEAKRKAAAKT